MDLKVWIVGTIILISSFGVYRLYKWWKADRVVTGKTTDPVVTEADSKSADKSKGAKEIKVNVSNAWTKATSTVGAIVIVIALIWGLVTLARSWSSRMSESEAREYIASEIARQKKAGFPSPDTTFYVTVTKEWSEPLVTDLDQCLHIKNMEPVAYEEMFDDGSTIFFPKEVIPSVTKTQIIDKHGRVVKTLTADKDGAFTIVGRHGRRLRVLGAESVVFRVRRVES